VELQRQLHRETERRFEQIERNQDNQRKTLDVIAVNTADLPRLKEQVGILERDGNRMKGGGAVAMGLLASWDIFKFILFKR
jgi:hypothetical protein